MIVIKHHANKNKLTRNNNNSHTVYNPNVFLPARRYASAGLCDSDVSVCLSIRLSHAGIVPSRAKAGS